MKLMSSQITFQICGSSSRPVQRRNPPMPVTRGSCFGFWSRLHSPAFRVPFQTPAHHLIPLRAMVRNFQAMVARTCSSIKGWTTVAG